MRISRAFGIIKYENPTRESRLSVIDTALESGYEPLSVYNEAFKKHAMQSAVQSKTLKLLLSLAY